MHRRICGSLHSPVTAFSIFYLLDGAKYLMRFYLQFPVYVRAWGGCFDDAGACLRAQQTQLRLRKK